MLLRRIVEHVKTQNWTAVILDLLIVVVGVFIGIQAANWNDERQASTQRAKSLDRLHAEAELSVARLRFVHQYFQRSVEARASVLRKAADGNIEAVEQEEAVLAVNYLAFFPAVSPPRSVYDEVISAGQYSDLGDENVRDAINKYYSALDNLKSSMGYARILSQQWPVWNHPAVSKEFDPEDITTQTRTVVDIEMALSDSLFVKSLQMGHSQQVFAMGIWESTLVVAEQMCQEIASYLGRTCAAIESNSSPVQ